MALGLLSMSLCGCADFIRWGEQWGDLGEPLEAWGSDVVGYEGRQY